MPTAVSGRRLRIACARGCAARLLTLGTDSAAADIPDFWIRPHAPPEARVTQQPPSRRSERVRGATLRCPGCGSTYRTIESRTVESRASDAA
jgi:hypothetical protein